MLSTQTITCPLLEKLDRLHEIGTWFGYGTKTDNATPPMISIAHHQRHGEIGDPVFTWIIFFPSIKSWEEAMNDARLKCLTQIRRTIPPQFFH